MALWLDRRDRPWLPRAEQIPPGAGGVDAALDRSARPERAAAWLEACPALPATVDDLLARVVPVEGHGRALVELRFKGLDPRQPFVEVVGVDFPWSTDVLPPLVRAAASSWPDVQVRRLGLFLGVPSCAEPPDPGLDVPHVGAEPDLDWLVGPLARLRAQPGPRLTVRPATPASMQHVTDAYEALARTAPRLAAELQMIDAAELERLCAEGTAFDAMISGRWAGLVALDRTPWLGVPALEVIEEVLRPDLRGRGLAASLQRAALGAVRLADERLVWGTIHRLNTPSRRTARRVGRELIGGRHLFAI